MIVRAARRMVRAISLGVFCRWEASTRRIIRSMKLCPGSAVTTTVIVSDNTLVPPVTALRSPPASRITGADSPVIADSSTVAAPLIISPSDGMISPADTMTISPFRRFSAGTCSVVLSGLTRCAIVFVRVFLSATACALPRPSARASAKLAKSTVNQSQSAIESAKVNG